MRAVLRLVMVAFYAAAGWLHLCAPDGFVAITPPFVPFPHAVVAATGVCELAGAAGLLVSPGVWALFAGEVVDWPFARRREGPAGRGSVGR